MLEHRRQHGLGFLEGVIWQYGHSGMMHTLVLAKEPVNRCRIMLLVNLRFVYAERAGTKVDGEKTPSCCLDGKGEHTISAS